MKWKWLFSFRGTVGRRQFLIAGGTLMAVKFLLDYLLASTRGAFWGPGDYYAGPYLDPTGGTPIWPLYLRHAILALPFVWIGTALTIQRLRHAGAPLSMVFLFFLPIVNLFFFALLCILPPKPAGPMVWPVKRMPASMEPPSAAQIAEGKGYSPWFYGSALIAALAAAALTWALVAFSTQAAQVYGWGLFMGAPFAGGLLAAILYGTRGPVTMSRSIQVALCSQLFTALALLVVAAEGFICLLMALPISLPLAMIGGAIGYQIQNSLRDNSVGATILPIVIGPLILAVEHVLPKTAPLFEVTTSVQIDAPPQTVWNNVVAFPALQPPSELMFKAGIAYPRSARIEGKGEGAMRYCVFSTGAFEEPITVWREPEFLAFDVSKCPPPMRELNPFGAPNPPHLIGFLVSERGQFRLVPTSDGGTRLIGTTWYRHNMAPSGYWRLWSDPILHAIHNRVLRHIQRLSEAQFNAPSRTKRP